jgi:hypothetical protein
MNRIQDSAAYTEDCPVTRLRFLSFRARPGKVTRVPLHTHLKQTAKFATELRLSSLSLKQIVSSAGSLEVKLSVMYLLIKN